MAADFCVRALSWLVGWRAVHRIVVAAGLIAGQALPGAAVLVVLAVSSSAAPAAAQDRSATAAELAQACQAAKTELAELEKATPNNSINGAIAAAERQIVLTCLRGPPPPPPPLPVCGTDENGAGTGQATYLQVYQSTYAKWCVDQSLWPGNSAAITPFFSYYDTVVSTLGSLFNLQVPLPIAVEVATPTPGDSVCDCGPKFGSQVAIRMSGDIFSDAYTNPQTNQSVPGFWGYLLTEHETINAYTGQVGGGGWPTDWWADDRSPFPNALDEEVMRAVGTSQNNPVLLNAATAQHQRFAESGQPGFDPETAMYVGFFNQYGGFSAYSRFFKLVEQDGLNWPTVSQDPNYTGDNNYSALLSEYVISYFSMAFGVTSDLTPTFVNAGVGKLNTVDGSTVISPYTVSSTAVRGIANAHCSIAATKAAESHVPAQTRSALQQSVSHTLAALQSGNYRSAVASGGTQASDCPSECAWVSQVCVAKW